MKKDTLSLFIKEYTLLQENNNEELLAMFSSRWNYLFREYGYYNIRPYSVLYTSKLIIQKCSQKV